MSIYYSISINTLTQPRHENVVFELVELWNYVKGAYCVKLSAIKLNLNSNCEDSVIFMQIVENILQYLLATHLRQGSL